MSLQDIERWSGPTGQGFGSSDMHGVWDKNSQGRCRSGSCTCFGELPTELGARWDHAPYQRTHFKQAVRGISKASRNATGAGIFGGEDIFVQQQIK